MITFTSSLRQNKVLGQGCFVFFIKLRTNYTINFPVSLFQNFLKHTPNNFIIFIIIIIIFHCDERK